MNGSDTLPGPVSDVRAGGSPSSLHLLIAVVVLAAAGVAAYWNSFAGAMVFDDLQAIRDNPSIRHLADLGAVLAPPADSPTAGRPLVNLTLAINYAISGTDLWSYHAVNLVIHLLAALVLMGVVRRTLLTAPLVKTLGPVALALGAGAALVWMLHPVQTEAVTYLTQRSESLGGLLYLLTLYCVIRGAGAATASAGWYIVAVLACAAGAASNPVDGDRAPGRVGVRPAVPGRWLGQGVGPALAGVPGPGRDVVDCAGPVAIGPASGRSAQREAIRRDAGGRDPPVPDIGVLAGLAVG